MFQLAKPLTAKQNIRSLVKKIAAKKRRHCRDVRHLSDGEKPIRDRFEMAPSVHKGRRLNGLLILKDWKLKW